MHEFDLAIDHAHVLRLFLRQELRGLSDPDKIRLVQADIDRVEDQISHLYTEKYRRYTEEIIAKFWEWHDDWL